MDCAFEMYLYIFCACRQVVRVFFLTNRVSFQPRKKLYCAKCLGLLSFHFFLGRTTRQMACLRIAINVISLTNNGTHARFNQTNPKRVWTLWQDMIARQWNNHYSGENTMLKMNDLYPAGLDGVRRLTVVWINFHFLLQRCIIKSRVHGFICKVSQ